MSANAISADTPKNGPRQEIDPRTPPMSGPAAMPRPQSACQPTISSTVSDMPVRPAPAMMTSRPSSSVRLGPIRLATTPVMSIATPITAM
jgi:hypothetical protein